MTEEGHGGRALLVFLGPEPPTQDRLDSQDREEGGRGDPHHDPFRLSLSGEVPGRGSVDGHVGEAGLAGPPPLEAREGLHTQVPPRRQGRDAPPLRVGLVDRDQLRGILVGRGGEENPLHHAEHCGGRTDPQTEGSNGHEGEEGALQEGPKAKAEILGEGIHGVCFPGRVVVGRSMAGNECPSNGFEPEPGAGAGEIGEKKEE